MQRRHGYVRPEYNSTKLKSSSTSYYELSINSKGNANGAWTRTNWYEGCNVMPVGWLANNTFKASSVAIWQLDPLKTYL